ncbi:coiled-coil domain-containing protein AGAP005037-like isoform X2 [Ptychodera flava]|uniref:coiled-coil domain-containing protein AGAP005037-like isoform X2 n=1 Tax=Ptychodera flava TaxID=63121 RepID=UPI00396A4D9C
MDKLLKKSHKKSKQSKTSKSGGKQDTDGVTEKRKKSEEKGSKGRKRKSELEIVHNVQESSHGQTSNGEVTAVDHDSSVRQDLKSSVKAESNVTESGTGKTGPDGLIEVPSSSEKVNVKPSSVLAKGIIDISVGSKYSSPIADNISETSSVSISATSQPPLSASEFNRRHTIAAGDLLQETISYQGQSRDKQETRHFSMDDADMVREPQVQSNEFNRGSKYRSSLPVVRPAVNMSKARPLGLIYLQYLNQTKRAWMPNEITGIDTIRALFVRAFPKHLSMYMMTQADKKIYIRDQLTEIFYELEDVREVKDRSIVRLVSERTATSESNVKGSMLSSSRPATSYYSEPEYGDGTNMRQHKHATITSTTTTVRQQQRPTTPQKQQQQQHQQEPSSAVYMYKTERVASPTLHNSQTRGSIVIDNSTIPKRTPQVYNDYAERSRTMKSATLPSSHRLSDTDRLQEPLQRKQVYSPVRQVASSPAHKPKVTATEVPSSPGQRPLSAPSPIGSSTPQRIEYTTAHGITPTNPEYLVRSLPLLNNGSISDSETLRVHQQSLSGRSTPAMSDSDAGYRMSMMEQQIANLAGLVHTALVKRPQRPPQDDHSSCSSQEDLVNLSEEILRTTKRNSLALSESSKSARSGVITESTVKDDSSTTPQAYSPVRSVEIRYAAQTMNTTCKHLREDLKQIRKLHLQQTQQSRDMLRDAFQSLQFVLQSNPSINQHPVRAHRAKLHQEFLHYVQQNQKIDNNLSKLEVAIEEMRENVINKRCQVNVQDLEGLAQSLGNVSKMLAEQKVSFPILHDNMKKVMAGEMEVVVQEERFIKEEPLRLDSALKRCKKLTGTLFTLKRLSSVQEYHPPTSPTTSTFQEQYIVATPRTKQQSTPTTSNKQDFFSSKPSPVHEYHTSTKSAFQSVRPPTSAAVRETGRSPINQSKIVQNVKTTDESSQRKRLFMTEQELQNFEKSLQMGRAQLRETTYGDKINQRHREHLCNMYNQEGHHATPQQKSTKVPPPPPPRKFLSIKQYSPSIQSLGTTSTSSTVTVQTSPNIKTALGSGGEGSQSVIHQTVHGGKVEIKPNMASTRQLSGSSNTSRITTTVIDPVKETTKPAIGSSPDPSATKTVIRPSKATLGVIRSPLTPEEQIKQPDTTPKNVASERSSPKFSNSGTDKVDNVNRQHPSTATSGNFVVYKTTTIVTSPPPKPPRLTSASDSNATSSIEQSSKKLPPPVPQRNSSILSAEHGVQQKYQGHEHFGNGTTMQIYTSTDNAGVQHKKIIKTHKVTQQASPQQMETVFQKRQSKELEDLSAAIAELETVTQQTQEEAKKIAGEIKKTQQRYKNQDISGKQAHQTPGSTKSASTSTSTTGETSRYKSRVRYETLIM